MLRYTRNCDIGVRLEIFCRDAALKAEKLAARKTFYRFRSELRCFYAKTNFWLKKRTFVVSCDPTDLLKSRRL